MAVFAGDLNDFALPAVLRVLSDNAKTGLLEVLTDDRPGGVELVDGRVRTASADRRRAGLARRLLGTGALDASTLLSVLEAEGPLAADHRVVEQLVRDSHLDAGDVAAALREHTIDAVLQMVRAAAGIFHFRPRPAHVGAPATLNLPVAELMEEVVRRQRAIEALTSAELPPTAVVVVAAPPAEAPVVLSPGGWQLLALLDGRRSIAELLEITPTGTEDTYRDLAELLDAGVATADPAAPTRAVLHDQQRLTDLERTWATEVAWDGASAPTRAPAGPQVADEAASSLAGERTATITSLSSRDPKRRAEAGPGFDERTLRRLVTGVETLP